MDIQILDLIKILLPGGAVIISVVSLVKSNRNTKRQIRIVKIEEIIECLRMFMSDYYLLHLIYQRQSLYENAPANSEKFQLDHLKDDYLEAVKVFNKNTNIEVFREKSPRLVMLANSYLPDKELKKKVLSVAGMVTALIQCTIFDNYTDTSKIFPKYPSPLNFLKYIEALECQLVKEMKMGYTSIKFEDLMIYQSKFLKDLKIGHIPR